MPQFVVLQLASGKNYFESSHRQYIDNIILNSHWGVECPSLSCCCNYLSSHRSAVALLAGREMMDSREVHIYAGSAHARQGVHAQSVRARGPKMATGGKTPAGGKHAPSLHI